MKENTKIIIALIVGMLISGVVVYAGTLLKASDVSYNETTVQEALNDIFIKLDQNKSFEVINLISEEWSNDTSKTTPVETTFTLTQGDNIYFTLPAKSEITHVYVKSITVDNSNGQYKFLHLKGSEWGRNNQGGGYNPYILVNDDLVYHSSLNGTGGTNWKDTEARNFDLYIDISAYSSITVYLHLYTYADTSTRSGGGYINLTDCEIV